MAIQINNRHVAISKTPQRSLTFALRREQQLIKTVRDIEDEARFYVGGPAGALEEGLQKILVLCHTVTRKKKLRQRG